MYFGLGNDDFTMEGTIHELSTGGGMYSPYMQGLANSYREELYKAFTTGSGIVADGATGGQALREQFIYLHDLIDWVSFTNKDAVGMSLIPRGNAMSTTVEFSTMDNYGSGGDGFVGETGSDAAFGVDYGDDNYLRQTETVKFLAEARQVSVVSQQVRNLKDPMAASKLGATRALWGKANLALYHGDSLSNALQWNGIKRQLLSWCDRQPSDQMILFDAGGLPLSNDMLEAIAILNRNNYGRGQRLIQSTTSFGDSQVLLFPQQRTRPGETGTQGTVFRTFQGPNGPIEISDDPMLRANVPLRADGPGSDGLPRTSGTFNPADGALDFNATPFVAASSTVGTQAFTPGSGGFGAATGNFWHNATRNTDSAVLATIPTFPTGAGNQSNHLAPGTYYYGVSVVYKGKEGPLYIYGAGSQSGLAITGTPTALTVATGKQVQLEFDPTTITGLGTTYAKSSVFLRIYRYGGPGASAPTQVNQFAFLENVAWPTSGDARYFDNGFMIPGSDSNFLITTEKEGHRGWEFLQLMPLMERPLPNLPLATPQLLLWFATPILPIRRHHIWIRNVGRP